MGDSSRRSRARVRQLATTAGVMCVTILLMLPGHAFAARTCEIASVSTDEAPANSSTFRPLVSNGGRHVVFRTWATNLVPGYAGGAFMRDRVAATTTCVSVSTSGVAANDVCSPIDITPDGRYVLLLTKASNFASDINSAQDLYVRDTVGGTTTRASLFPGGVSSNDSVGAEGAISDDGRYVVFSLPVLTSNGQAWNVYMRDMQAGVTNVVWDTRYDIFRLIARAPAISGNGRYVAFESNISIAPGDPGDMDIYVRDMSTGSVAPASVSSTGVWGNGNSSMAQLSADGRFVVFLSEASNLVPGDTNGIADLFLHDMASGGTVRINVGNAGEQGNGPVSRPSVSSDGRFVSFSSTATNLVPGDSNGACDMFVRDWVGQTTTRVSVGATGEQAQGSSGDGCISADGQFVSYASSAANLVPGDVNAADDAFVGAWSANQAVHRFYNVRNGSHFYTPSPEERDSVAARLSGTFRYEGVAYITSPANNTKPMHRFFNFKAGSHFYTADDDEAATIRSLYSSTYSYDGLTYAVNREYQPNSMPVYRFYNIRNGTHFYTADPNEKANVETNLRSTYSYDGVAFWIGQ